MERMIKQQIFALEMDVLSAKPFNAIVYKGLRREKQIYLYHYENHFDIITSISSFLGRGYWCLECMKGYDAKENHRCSKAIELGQAMILMQITLSFEM